MDKDDVFAVLNENEIPKRIPISRDARKVYGLAVKRIVAQLSGEPDGCTQTVADF